MMQVVRGFHCLPSGLVHPVLTIGNFDGVHIGHQRIIRLAIEKARAHQGLCVAMTFTPHPQEILRPGQVSSLRITTDEEKIELLERLGVDVLIEQPFDRDFAAMSPQEFFEKVICQAVGAKSIVIGYDFGFGKDRQGSIQTLSDLSKIQGIELTQVPVQTLESSHPEVISSSRVREFLLKGQIESANTLLGHEFLYRGIVVHGDGRGRKIGFPTANLKLIGTGTKLLLPNGVYVTHAFINGREYPSVTNIGVRPTFQKEGDVACVECHILDSQELDLYDQQLEIRFLSRLREEKKFAGINELKKQILEDIRRAQELTLICN